MYAEKRHPPQGKSRSDGLARTGAGFVWSSVLVGLLSLIIFFSYSIGGAVDGKTEDDFSLNSDGYWVTYVDLSDFGQITVTINAKEEDMKLTVTLYDGSGIEEDSTSGNTPLTFNSQVFSGGEYQLVIEIEEDDKTIDDLEVMVSTTSMNILFVCCGVTFLGLAVVALFFTGLIMLFMAVSKRKREREPPKPRYRYPPPPPPYYGRPPPYQMYPMPPPYYQQGYMGHQTEGYLGYEGPGQGYHGAPPPYNRRYEQW